MLVSIPNVLTRRTASESTPGHDASQARVRRRAKKRTEPPQLQFVTATDPSQFKDKNAKRSVRSQAMIQYRYKSDQQKKKGKEPSTISSPNGVKKRCL